MYEFLIAVDAGTIIRNLCYKRLSTLRFFDKNDHDTNRRCYKDSFRLSLHIFINVDVAVAACAKFQGKTMRFFVQSFRAIQRLVVPSGLRSNVMEKSRIDLGIRVRHCVLGQGFARSKRGPPTLVHFFLFFVDHVGKSGKK